MTYTAWFEPLDNPGRRWPLTEVIYRDPASGSLLDVVHDVEALKRHSGRAMEEAVRRAIPPY